MLMKTSRTKFLTIILIVLIVVIGAFPLLQDFYDSKDDLYGKDTQLEAVLKQADISSIPDQQLIDFARILMIRRMSKELQPYLTEIENRPDVGNWYYGFKYRDKLNNFMYDEAFTVLTEWISAYPDDAAALLRYSEHVLESDPESALIVIEKAKANSPVDSIYYDKLIRTIRDFIDMREVDQVKAYAIFLESEFNQLEPIRIKYLELLIKANEAKNMSGYGKFYIELGNLYSIYGISEKAIEAYEGAESHGSDASAYVGMEYFKNNDIGGINELVSAESRDSGDGLMLMGIREYLSENYESACNYFEDSLAKDPDNILNNYLLVYSYDAIGKKVKAIDAREKFVGAYGNYELQFSFDYYNDLLSRQNQIFGDNP